MRKFFKYLNKEIVRTGDLEPKGIRSTYAKDVTDFNTTFVHIWTQLK